MLVLARKPGVGKGVLECADDEPLHEAAVLEPHLGLGGMHVHIDAR